MNKKHSTHIVRSEYLTEGLFGQILIWCLEILPCLEKHDLKPEWNILSRNYGTSPEYNIFPDILNINYEPRKDWNAPDILSLEQLKSQEGHPNYSFKTDFALANQLFHQFFQLPGEVTHAVDSFFAPYTGQRILGLHYRGTDKLVDTYQSNPVTIDLMLHSARDFIKQKGNIDLVFLASDEEDFIAKADKELPVPVIYFQQKRKNNNSLSNTRKRYEPLFRGHREDNNINIGRLALIDSLLLSRCQYLLKCQSALSGWAKIWNPELEAYRIAAFKHDWFPDAFIPLYKTENSQLNAELLLVQKGEVSKETKLNSSLPVSEYLSNPLS
jgi:hypothetical protein